MLDPSQTRRLRAMLDDSRHLYVDAADGCDDNDGVGPKEPLRTFECALERVADSAAKEVFLHLRGTFRVRSIYVTRNPEQPNQRVWVTGYDPENPGIVELDGVPENERREIEWDTTNLLIRE